MSPAVQPTLLRETHRNSYLFSNYYLDNRLNEREDWRNDEAETRAAFEMLRQRWQEFSASGQNVNLNESQTEERWVRPVLEALGHRFAVQVALATPRQTRFPDYLLFAKDSDRAAAEHRSNQAPLTEDDLLASALAVADAKRWNRPLDKATKTKSDDVDGQISATPSVQIDFYIRHSGLDWGLLTNGRTWRLYHKATSKKLDVFYAVDLPALLEQGDLDAFRYFYRFFRQAAFLPDAGGRCWLDLIRERSDTYERGVSDTLRKQVYNALRNLAQGFLDFPANGLDSTPETLKTIYDNSLIVLYRLLFILYAEDRNLLPVDTNAGGNAAYRNEYSFKRIKEEVVKQKTAGSRGVATRSSLWNNLAELWETIDRGDPNLDVPAYNGGLFKPQNHPFLQQHRVGDSHLIEAIDELARVEDPETGLRVFVDYRDLEIRHLGSIYEGLLEYNLQVDEDGRVDLLTDKGERKATGSYYTPDYIVQYIVEQTVGPVLDELLETVTGDAEDKVGADVDAEAGVELARRALQINVLDPAMGSGHFLVAATDFIARWLVEWGAVRSDGEQLVDDASALTYWRRRVAQACIYGVDLNPLAVELAKLALWLTTVAQDKPLSFLDHHLRCGNSLIGARLDELTLGVPRQKSTQKTKERKARAAGQMTMLDDSAFVGSLRTATRWMGDIEGLSGETLAEVRVAEQIYQQTVRDATRTLRTIADVWTAQHFGLSEDVTYLQSLSRHLLHPGGIAMPRYETTVQQARALAAQHRFFHWELEFPEVFFDEEGQPLGEEAGFDAVVGNPPYDELSEEERGSEIKEAEYLKATVHLKPALGYRINLYRLFVIQAVQLMNGKAWHGFIVPLSLLADQFTLPLRKYLLEQTTLQRIELFPQKDNPRERVFLDAKLSTCIYILQNDFDSRTSTFVRTHLGKDLNLDSPQYTTEQENFSRFDPEGLSIPGMSQEAWNIILKLSQKDYQQLGDVLRTFRGELMINRSFKPYSVDKGKGEEVIRGSHIGMYKIVIPKQGEAIYVNRQKYLEEHPNSETAKHHQAPRVVYQRYAAIDNYRRLISTVLPEGHFCSHTVGYIQVSDENFEIKFFVSLLNSTLLDWRFNFTSTNNNINGYEVEALPIPRIDFTTPADERERLAAQGQRLYAQFSQPTARSHAPRGNAASDALRRPADAERPVPHPHAERGDESEPLLDFVGGELAAGRSDVVHDLLAFLAEQMIALHEERQRLQRADDPFKWLDRGAAVDKLERVFRDEVTYGERIGGPLLDQPHDLDGLRLTQSPNGWLLEAQLKLREVDDPKQWQKEANERDIVREWVAVYRFPHSALSEAKARYYRYALQTRADFAHAKNFPGGATRSAAQKLRLTTLPIFDDSVDLTPLDGLRAELAAVREQIEQTDRLIDQIVYRLYGLTEEEVALVEGR